LVFGKSIKTPAWLVLFLLILAGEMVFSLPFHVARFFRPTFLEVFQLTNTELGDAFAVYGIIAMLSYLPGGPLADRFSARNLMAVSLVATGLGGIYLGQVPGKTGLMILFGYWGATTIFLFWAALIKTTREWGGSFRQGKAFGLLDGGRGLVAAGIASLMVWILSERLSPGTVDPVQREQALKTVIYAYSFLTMGAGILVWLFVPFSKRTIGRQDHPLRRGFFSVLKNKAAWMQAIIVVCAYCAYKGLDYYSLYAHEVLGMDEVEAARFVSNASYLRAVGAIGAGFIVDRFRASKVILITFFILVVSYLISVMAVPDQRLPVLLLLNIVITFTAVYALRGVYFTLLEESKISGTVTGTAVGLISLVGYTPDVFFHPLTGRILDAAPGLPGYQHFFLILAGFSVFGMLITAWLSRTIKTRNRAL
jgi:sugar phosphate permease